MKSVITITKQEIESAVREYIEDRIKPNYSYIFTDVTALNFRNKDGEIGYFECDFEVFVEKEERPQ